MNYNRVLTIQDISCLGQCSLTVALPILSACGQETVILPSALLSTHSGGFKDFTFRDLTDDIPFRSIGKRKAFILMPSIPAILALFRKSITFPIFLTQWGTVTA